MAAEKNNVRLDLTRLKQIADQTPERADKFTRYLAEEVMNEAKLSFNTSPPGRTYFFGSVAHTASLPGYPPNIDTGTLSNSLNVRADGEMTYRVQDGVNYGAWLELDLDRAFLTPAVERVRADLGTLAMAFGLVE